MPPSSARDASRSMGVRLLPPADRVGKPENANVSNLPEPYFMQTVADFKNGNAPQHGSDILPHSGMVAAIMPTTDAEVREA